MPVRSTHGHASEGGDGNHEQAEWSHQEQLQSGLARWLIVEFSLRPSFLVGEGGGRSTLRKARYEWQGSEIHVPVLGPLNIYGGKITGTNAFAYFSRKIIWTKGPKTKIGKMPSSCRRRTNVQQLTCNICLSRTFYYLFFSFVLLELKPFVYKWKVLGKNSENV